MNIENKVVVVTGAASGIGRALSRAFKNARADKVYIADLNEEGLAETADLMDGIAIKTDVSKESEIRSLIEEVNKENDIDIFCSNAGIGGEFGLLDTTAQGWQSIWDINVMSHIHAAKYCLPNMLKRESGYFMNTASAAGLLTQIGAAPYSVTKAAAVSFAEWLKITYGSNGIGVTCLCPQAVRTAMTANGPGVAGVDGMIEPEECAAEVLDAIVNERFLAAPHKEVLEYVSRKGNDRDRWISGMQRLQTQFTDFIESADPNKDSH